MPSRPAGFEIRIGRRLGDRRIQVDFASGHGVAALSGPSGAGKTSVLNMVAGLLRPDHGRIVVAGVTLFDAAAGIDLPVQQRRAGYVFQDNRLFPHRRVRANLLYGRGEAGPLSFADTVALLSIGHLLDRFPRTLSGGEARRVAIGRALLSNPRFLLLDEPLSSLDAARQQEILRMIERLRDVLGLPILYVDHDGANVKRLASTVVLL